MGSMKFKVKEGTGCFVLCWCIIDHRVCSGFYKCFSRYGSYLPLRLNFHNTTKHTTEENVFNAV